MWAGSWAPVRTSKKKEAIRMETIITCQDITKSWGSRPVFQDLSLSFGPSERAGLTGRNGSGKSTLINILAGKEQPDQGLVTLRKHLRTGLVPQVPDFSPGLTVIQAAKEAGQKAKVPSDELDVQVSILLSQAGFTDQDQLVSNLSGGWQKRLAICCGCLGNPDFVFFDEPTNHLDWEGILWLEEFLKNAPFGWLTISHDRYLLNSVVQKVIELSPQFEKGYLLTRGSWDQHLEERDAHLESSRQQHESIQNQLRREEAWLHQGIKARGTRARHRVDAAAKLRDDVQKSHQRQQVQKTDLEFTSSGRKTKKLMELKNITLKLGDKTLLENFSTILSGKTRTGILGPNGCGKTSLFRLLTQELSPQAGSVLPAPQLEVVYFDQQREQLNPQHTLKRALSEHGDHVIFQDRSVHIVSWAKRFGFTAERLDVPVEKLSGGEQARVLIANLMLKKADLLLLDEPTNDLDISTIEVLEENLQSFPGAVLIISHDRYLLSKTCDHFLGFGPHQKVIEYADVAQWLQDQSNAASQKAPQSKKKESAEAPKKSAGTGRTQKLSYKEKREYENMEAEILVQEEKLETLTAKTSEPDIQSNPARMQELYLEMQQTQERIDNMYKRWSELEEKV